MLNVQDTFGEIFQRVLGLPPKDTPDPPNTDPTGPTKKTAVVGLEKMPVIIPLPGGHATLLGYAGWTHEIDTVFAVKITGDGATVLNADSELQHLLIAEPSALKIVGSRRLDVDGILQSEGRIVLTPDSMLRLNGRAEMVGPSGELNIQHGASLYAIHAGTVELQSGGALTVDVRSADETGNPESSTTYIQGNIHIDEASTLTTRFEPGDSRDPSSGSKAYFGSGTITNDNLVSINAPTELAHGGHLINNAAMEIGSSLKTIANTTHSIVNNGLINVKEGGEFALARGLTGKGAIVNHGDIVLQSASEIGSIYNSGHLTMHSTLDFDEIVLDGGSINAPSFGDFTIGSDSSVRGNGTINGNVYSQGLISPGFSAGLLEIDGDLKLDPLSALEMEIYGGGLDEYDRIKVTGDLTLAGTLLVALGETTAFDAGWTFDLLTGGSVTGGFDHMLLPLDSDGNAVFSYGWFGGNLRLTSLQPYDGAATVVPLPSSVVLAGVGMAMAGWKCRRKVGHGQG